MISEGLIKADKVIKVGIAEQQPSEPMVRFGRLDPEWVGPRSLQGYYDVYLEAPFSPGLPPAS
jgi:hypothetical protein